MHVHVDVHVHEQVHMHLHAHVASTIRNPHFVGTAAVDELCRDVHRIALGPFRIVFLSVGHRVRRGAATAQGTHSACSSYCLAACLAALRLR